MKGLAAESGQEALLMFPPQPPPYKAFVLAAFAPSVVNFRGSLIAAMVQKGWHVTAAAADYDAPTRSRVSALGAKALTLTTSRQGMNPFSDLAYGYSLWQTFRKERPDVVLAYTIKPVIWGMLAAHLAGVRRKVALITGLGYAFTDDGNAGLKRSIAKFFAATLYRLSLARADRVLFQNPDDRDLFLSKGLVKDRGQIEIVNGSGVDLNLFCAASLPDPPVFLMIGRFLGDKGVREYATAALRLKASYPEARFQLVGYRDTGPDSVSQAELDSWVAGGIENLGRQDDVRPALAAARVYVLPSYREGTPRSVLEAMAMGRPIITTDAPGCRETVQHGWNGLLVKPRDVDTLIEAMERFLLEPELAVTMGRNSHELCQRKYDVRLVNQQMIEALAPSPPHPSS